jgi:hypothetical protein
MLHTFVIRPTQERKVWSLVHLREVIKYGCTSEFVRSRVTLLQCQQPPTQLFVYLKLFRSSPTQFYDLRHNYKLGNLRKKSQQNVSRQESDEISDSPRKTRVFTPFFPGTFPLFDVNNAHISNVGMCNDATVNVTRDVSFRCIVIKTNSRKDAFEESAFDK